MGYSLDNKIMKKTNNYLMMNKYVFKKLKKKLGI